MLLDPARFAGQVAHRAVGLYLIQSEGLQVAICNHGARIVQLITPNRQGEPQDVVLGFDSLPQMLSGLPSMGAFIGRFANRIAGARYGVGGHEHRLPANDGAHCLHGGPQAAGFRCLRCCPTRPASSAWAGLFKKPKTAFRGTCGWSCSTAWRVALCA